MGANIKSQRSHLGIFSWRVQGKQSKKLSVVTLLPTTKYKISTVSSHLQSDTHLLPTRKWSQVLALLPVYLLQICYGMNSGFPAILTPQLREDCSEFSITPDQESWIVSLDNLLTPVICLLSGPLQQKWGPRTSLMVCCFPYFISWLLTFLAQSYQSLYVARVLVGVSHAFLSTSIYTIEVSSNDMRGTFSVLESVLRCVGCVLVYILGLFFRWKDIAGVALGIPVLGLLAFLFSPESPVYLISKEKYDKAEKSMEKLYGPQYSTKQQALLLSRSQRHNSSTSSNGSKFEYITKISKHPEVYKPLFIVFILSVIQQFSGVSVIRAYVVKIFDEVFNNNSTYLMVHDRNASQVDCENLGIVHRTSTMAYLSAITIGLFRLTASLTLARLLLRYPRRKMYMLSLASSIIFLASFALFSHLSHQPETSLIFKWSSLVAACCLVFSVQLGVQTLPLLLSGELFPAEVRAVCKGLTRSWTCILLILSLKSFPILESSFTISGTFLSFSLLLAISFPLIFCILPETKDLSLDVIQEYFRRHSEHQVDSSVVLVNHNSNSTESSENA